MIQHQDWARGEVLRPFLSAETFFVDIHGRGAAAHDRVHLAHGDGQHGPNEKFGALDLTPIEAFILLLGAVGQLRQEEG